MPDETTAQPPANQPAPAGPSMAPLPEAMLEALKRSGTRIEAVRVYEVPEYALIELDALCTQPTARKGCSGESPLLVVQRYAEFPDAEDFSGYVGFFRAECVTGDGDFIAFTHYMRSKDTGQMGPLAEFFADAVVPFLLRIAKMDTRKGFTVFRPIPAVIGGDDTQA